MATVFPDGAYKAFKYITVDTNENPIYTCPAAGFLAAHVVWVAASDDAADARTITLTWRDSSASVTYTLNYQAAIAANTAFEREFKPLVLEPGDTLRATGSATGIHITGAVIEVARPSRGGG